MLFDAAQRSFLLTQRSFLLALCTLSFTSSHGVVLLPQKGKENYYEIPWCRFTGC
jgi:hypothetical protein